jgi:hypothetical protein
MTDSLATALKVLRVLEDRSMFDRDVFLPYDLKVMIEELTEVMDDFASSMSDDSYSIGFEDGRESGYDSGYDAAREKMMEALDNL